MASPIRSRCRRRNTRSTRCAALQNLPINAAGAPTTVLGGIADIPRTHSNAVVSQYDISSMVQIYATTQGRDLGAVSSDIQKIITANDKDKPKGAIVALVGQTATMNSAYSGLLLGLLGAIVLVYFVIVINFQSWSDPFIVITALPAALAGIVWMLFATHTTLSVPALTGAIMCMGVATANSVLVISFAREKLTEFGNATQAALEAGFVRIRPVLMTALAMVIGMLPMALGFGEGGEQNAPLGRAVIGGPDFRHRLHVVFRARGIQYHASPRRPQSGAARPTSEKPMSQPDPRPGRRRCAAPAPRRHHIFALVAIAIVVFGLVSRAAQNSRLRDLTEARAVPTVAIVAPAQVENEQGLDLPGRLEAFIRAPIYARVPGYLKSWKYDIGSKVKTGDVLAEIDTPDLDQQLMQARAALSVAEANAKLAQITAERWQSLAGTDAVAKQDVDQRTFTWNANVAQVKAAKANVDQLVAEEGFKRLIAPFDGIVTARDTDIGALINGGAAGGAELFVVSETGKLRVYVSVPQNYVPSVPPGTKATIRVPEHPGKILQRNGRGVRAGRQPELGYDAHADHRRQCRGRVDARRLREHSSANVGSCRGAQRAVERAYFRRQGTVHRDRRRRQSRGDQAGIDPARPGHR